MGIDFKKIGANKVVRVDDKTHLLMFFTWKHRGNISLTKNKWQVVKNCGNSYEVFTIKKGDKLDERQALSCAKVLLGHINDATTLPKDVEAIEMKDASSRKSVAYSVLSGKELAQLTKTEIPLPITFKCSKTYSLEQIQEKIRQQDTFALHGFNTVLDETIFQKAVNALAETEPHVIHALIFKLLAESHSHPKTKKVCKMLCQCLKCDLGQPSPYSLIEWNKVTPENIFFLAMLHSGFDPRVLAILKSQGFSQNCQWSGMTPVQFAEMMGAPESVLKILDSEPRAAIRSLCQDVDLISFQPFIEKFSDIHHYTREIAAIDAALNLPSSTLSNNEKLKTAADFFRHIGASNRDPVKLLDECLSKNPDYDPLHQYPRLLATLCASFLLTSEQKIAMTEKLLKRHESVLLSRADNKEAVARAMVQCSIDRAAYFNMRLNDGNSVLRAAIIQGGADWRLIRFLMQKGAIIDEVDAERNTLLHASVLSENLAALEILTALGVQHRVNAKGCTAFELILPKDPLGWTVVDVLSGTEERKKNFAKMIAFMLEKDFPLTSDSDHNKEIFLVLVPIDAEIAVRFFKKHLALCSVCYAIEFLKHYPEGMAALIPLAKANSEGLDKVTIEMRGLHGVSKAPLLFFAARSRSPLLLKALLDAGLPCEERFQGMTLRNYVLQLRPNDKTPESSAVLSEMSKIVEEHFLTQGIPLTDERTPFHDAAIKGDIEGCKKFIAEGGFLPQDIHGLTPMDLAMIHGHKGLVAKLYKALERREIYVAPSPTDTVSSKSIAVPVTTLVGPKVLRQNFNRSSIHGGSLLAHALAGGNEALAELAWKYDPSEDGLGVDGRMRYKYQRSRERVFEALYYIACNKDLATFQKAYQWFKSQTEMFEDSLIAAVAAKNLLAASWICAMNLPALSEYERGEAVRLTIQNDDLAMLKVLAKNGVFNGAGNLTEPLRFAIEKDDPEVFLMLVDSQKYDLTYDLSPSMKQILAAREHKILKAMISKCSSLQSRDVEEVMVAMQTSFGDLKSIPTIPLIYFMQHARSKEDWLRGIQMVKRITDSFEKGLSALFTPDAFFDQIFVEILQKFQRKLKNEDNVVEKLFAIFQKVKSKTQVALYFNALQRGCSLEELSVAIELSQEKETNGFPTPEQFRLLPKDKKLQWLSYISVSAYRAGFDLSWQSIREESDPELICMGLKGLEKIGMTIPLKKVRSCLAPFFDHPNEAVRCQAVKTLSSVVPDANCEYSKEVLLKQLSRKDHSTETLITLIQLVGYYHFNPAQPIDRKIIDAVIACSSSLDRNIRIQSALTLSRIQDDAALKRAVEIVKSHDWDFMDEFFGEDQKYYPGGWWLFVYRPEFHDSRSALLTRIRDTLAVIYKEKIAAKVDERMKAFEQDPKSFPEIAKNQLSNVSACRYIPIPIYFPTTPGSYLMRGLKARKGDALFYESVRDLIRKGCGKSDLTCFDAEFCAGSWSKVGAMFASHAAHMAQSYFKEGQGCLIMIDPAYYNTQYRKGFARLEHEGAINNVFYNGIPKNAIKLIYVSNEFEFDLHMLNSDKQIDEKFKSKLTSDAFKNCTLEELRQFRTYLHEKMEPLMGENGPITIHNQTFNKTFFDVFRFIEPTEGGINQRLAKDGVKDIPVDAVGKETIRAAVARQVIAEELAPVLGIDFFLSQDEMLSKLDDAEFAKNFPKVFELLHLDKLPFKETKARHGVNDEGVRASAYDHTLEMIAGQHGGFGLHTRLALTAIDQEKTRRLLRLAAMYHYVGRLPLEGEKQGSLVERSAKIAVSEMQKRMKLQGISHVDAVLVSLLILHHQHFGEFLKGKISLEQLEQRLTAAYKEIPLDVAPTKADFTKMLWALFTARASTLRKVQEMGQHYQTYLDFEKLDCTMLNWINDLREQIRAAPSSSPHDPCTSEGTAFEIIRPLGF